MLWSQTAHNNHSNYVITVVIGHLLICALNSIINGFMK